MVLRWIDREAVEARYRGTQVRRMLAGALEAAPEHGCADPRFDLELLQRCVDRLKPDARSLIEQSYFAGLDTPAMAKLRDSTLDAIWMALSRARAALRQCIEAKLRQTGDRSMNRFALLVEAYLADTLSEADEARLVAYLHASPKARAHLQATAAIDDGLREFAQQRAPAAAMREAVEARIRALDKGRDFRRKLTRRIHAAAVAARPRGAWRAPSWPRRAWCWRWCWACQRGRGRRCHRAPAALAGRGPARRALRPHRRSVGLLPELLLLPEFSLLQAAKKIAVENKAVIESHTETGKATGTKDKHYTLIWFTEQCLSNALRLETYAQDAERDDDSELADFFKRAQSESRKGAEQGKDKLRKRLAG